MDDVVTRLYATLTPAQLDTIREEYILHFLTADERSVLARNYWYFDVNVPVKVSLMRDRDQKVVPFWLPKSGFEKTNMLVKNEEYTYEVWQKNFLKGQVSLGINGFDMHRPVYFISVEAVNPEDKLEITKIFPENQHLDTMRVGAFTYHDWDELTITGCPESLRGQLLFTTIRGRAREAHIVRSISQNAIPIKPCAGPAHAHLEWQS